MYHHALAMPSHRSTLHTKIPSTPNTRDCTPSQPPLMYKRAANIFCLLVPSWAFASTLAPYSQDSLLCTLYRWAWSDTWCGRAPWFCPTRVSAAQFRTPWTLQTPWRCRFNPSLALLLCHCCNAGRCAHVCHSLETAGLSTGSSAAHVQHLVHRHVVLLPAHFANVAPCQAAETFRCNLYTASSTWNMLSAAHKQQSSIVNTACRLQLRPVAYYRHAQ